MSLIKKWGYSLSAAAQVWLTITDRSVCRYIPVYQDWRLNERMYGALQGLDKKETVEKHGTEQVNIWRRSYATPPPKMERGHEFDPRKVKY